MLQKSTFIIIVFLLVIAFTGCEKQFEDLTPQQLAAADTLLISHEILKELLAKPLYEFNESDIDVYLPYLQYTIPGLRDRIQHLARKNLNQPYEIYLLGEYPVEIYDAQPLYCLDKSDCVVFCEHILAMSLAYDWQSFFAILQRIRYKDGIISYATRNHYGEYDWMLSNTWLAEDMTKELVGERAIFDTTHVNKTHFFKKRGVPYTLPEDSLVWSFISLELIPKILPQLQTGDLVNVVRGYKHNKWVGHFGFVMVNDDGTVNFLHSAPPQVKEQPFLELLDAVKVSNLEKEEYNIPIEATNEEIKAYNENHEDQQAYERVQAYTLGYRFLRLKENPLQSILKENQELRLQVVPVVPEAIKATKRDSVLRGLTL